MWLCDSFEVLSNKGDINMTKYATAEDLRAMLLGQTQAGLRLMRTIQGDAEATDGTIVFNENSRLAEAWRAKFGNVMQQILEAELPAVQAFEIPDDEVVRALQSGAILAALDTVVGLQRVSADLKF